MSFPGQRLESLDDTAVAEKQLNHAVKNSLLFPFFQSSFQKIVLLIKVKKVIQSEKVTARGHLVFVGVQETELPAHS